MLEVRVRGSVGGPGGGGTNVHIKQEVRFGLVGKVKFQRHMEEMRELSKHSWGRGFQFKSFNMSGSLCSSNSNEASEVGKE